MKELQKIKKQVAENTNGLKAVQLQMENMSHIRNDLTLLMGAVNDLKETRKSNKEVIQLLSNLKWGKKVFIGFIAFLGSIIGLLLGLKELMK